MMSSSIATKRGDGGYTDLIGGHRVSKSSLRVEAYGVVDELVAAIGLARATSGHQMAAALAKELQRELFAVSEALARGNDDVSSIDATLHERLTEHVRRIEREEGILGDWSIPGDHLGGAAFDVARTVCRRAERAVVRARESGEPMDANILVYLNRLADLLWLLGRVVERDAGVSSNLRAEDDRRARWSKAWP